MSCVNPAEIAYHIANTLQGSEAFAPSRFNIHLLSALKVGGTFFFFRTPHHLKEKFFLRAWPSWYILLVYRCKTPLLTHDPFRPTALF